MLYDQVCKVIGPFSVWYIYKFRPTVSAVPHTTAYSDEVQHWEKPLILLWKLNHIAAYLIAW